MSIISSETEQSGAPEASVFQYAEMSSNVSADVPIRPPTVAVEQARPDLHPATDTSEIAQEHSPPQDPSEPQSDQHDPSPDLSSAVEALRQLAGEIAQAQQNWLARNEDHVVRVAVAIAERIIRRELNEDPEIPLALVREALELTAGSSQMRVALNPADFQALGSRVHDLAQTFARNSQVEVTEDEKVSAGGCRVDTRWGTIDQTIEAQLSRITEELLADD